MKKTTHLLLFVLASAAGHAQNVRSGRPVVLLDAYHNNESQPHYRWEAAYPGGFSEFGKLLQSLGAELKTTTEPLTPARLAGVDCLIIVDPDTPKETATPNHIGAEEIQAVREWVRAGGRLVLLGNDPGNAEFEHFNRLAGEFGLEFLQTRHVDGPSGGRLTLRIPPDDPIFTGGGEFFAVDVAPLRVTAQKAQALISSRGTPIMVLVEHGRGRVLALGDPWLYNEYINSKDNRLLAEKLFRAILPGTGKSSATSAVPVDSSGLRPGPIDAKVEQSSVVVTWPDEASRTWRAEFSRIPGAPMITSISVAGKPVIEGANPVYRCVTGKRRGGWDEFFDHPGSHPDGTRAFRGSFRPVSGWVRTVGDRVEVHFDGLQMGIFRGGIRYVFYPGSRLVRQEAVVTTNEPDTAFYYDAGIRFANGSVRQPGLNVEPEVVYFDTTGNLRSEYSAGPDATPVKVRYRAVAGRTANGAMAVFPPPHQYFFARDWTTNLSNLWYNSWRASTSIGIRHPSDDGTRFYPGINAPPGTEQHLGVFYLLTDSKPVNALEDVLRFTNRDRFPDLEGYRKVAVHWHFAFTVQAMKKGLDWTPPWKPVLKNMGVDAVVLSDFHGDGNPRDLTGVRLQELDAYFKSCRAQSDPGFLLIPGEEPNVHLGGHWAVSFPKPVYWFMGRPPGKSSRISHPQYGIVYSVADQRDLMELFRREDALVYTSHPRTKSSQGYPDKYRDKEFYIDPHFFGGAWKAMNSDLSSPRMGDRALKLLDDMNNWGQPKRILGEVDVFQIDPTHELYGHMNINYVRLGRLPDFENYGRALEPLVRGDFFVSTGEVLLPESSITPGGGDEISARARIRWSFPLKAAEVIWGDGTRTFSKTFPLETTRPFGDSVFQWKLDAAGWKWARIAVWDVASNGAFINPVWRPRQ